MSQLQKIEAIAKKDLGEIKIVEPVNAMVELGKMNELLQSSIEEEDSSDEEIFNCIAPICAQYREKAELVVFETIPGVDPKRMYEYQISGSNYYRMCADAMSKLMQILFLRMAQRDD